MRGRKPVKIELRRDLPVVARLNAVWPLAERVGTTCYNRRHQGRYDGTLATGANRPTWYEQGLSFDGADYWETAEGLSPDGIGTTGCWFIMSSFGSANRYLFSNYVTADAQRRDCYVTSAGNLGFRVVTPFTDSGVALSNGVLYHAALTWQTNVGWTGYLDGKAVAADSSGTLTEGKRTRFGARGNSNSTSNAYIGRILWSYASPYRLAAEEIAELHRLGARVFERPPLSVVWAEPAAGGIVTGEAALSGVGTMSAGLAQAVAGAAAMSAQGAAQVGAAYLRAGAAALAGSGDLAAGAAEVAGGAAGLSGQSLLGTSGAQVAGGAAGLSGEGLLDQGAARLLSAAAALGGVVTLDQGAAVMVAGGSALSGVLNLEAAGNLIGFVIGAAQFQAVSALASQGASVLSGMAQAEVESLLAAGAAYVRSGANPLSGLTTLNAGDVIILAGGATLTGRLTLTGSGTVLGDTVYLPPLTVLVVHRRSLQVAVAHRPLHQVGVKHRRRQTVGVVVEPPG